MGHLADLYYLWAILLVVANSLAWCTTFFSLPGNWMIVGATALFAWLVEGGSGQGIGWSMVGLLVVLALVGEILEFAASAAGAARQGASRRAVILSLVGAVSGSIAGVLVGLPIPLVGSAIAAVLGGAAGAYAGAYLGEQWKGRAYEQRVAIGRGAFVGRLWGTVAKLAVGAMMVVLATMDSLINLDWL
jgi:uncharacterized protein YqgC (DUF456 family)